LIWAVEVLLAGCKGLLQSSKNEGQWALEVLNINLKVKEQGQISLIRISG
jgi:hypothetical protein